MDKEEIVHSEPRKRDMEQIDEKFPHGLALKKLIA